MTPRKKESALGRGLDALIRPDFFEEEKKFNGEKRETKSESKSTRSPIKKLRKTRDNNHSKSTKDETKTKTSTQSEIGLNDKDNKPYVDEILVENVILEVRKNPRISLWSAKSAAVLRLLKKTKPEFSISKEASTLIEEAVKDKYPDMWEVFENKEI